MLYEVITAVTDTNRIIASALETVPTHELEAFLTSYLKQNEVEKIIIGMPVQLNNTPSESVKFIQPVINRLKKVFPEMDVITSYSIHYTKLYDPYRRRHLWNTHMLELKMLGKLKNHENLSPVITEVFKPLEKEFYLSDNDLISLENIKEEDVVQSAENESVEEIRKRILLFIETGRFNAK